MRLVVDQVVAGSNPVSHPTRGVRFCAELPSKFQGELDSLCSMQDSSLTMGFLWREDYAYGEDEAPGKNKQIPHASFEALICHDCAHALFEQNPWMNDLLRPFHSHSHKQDC